MKSSLPSHAQLKGEIAELRLRLEETTEILNAIRNGEVDAVLGPGPQGDQLFTLRGADDPYRVLIEEMNQGAVTLSADGSILYGNRRFAELLKIPVEEILGASFVTLVSIAERADFEILFEAGRTGGSVAEVTLSGGDGGAVPLQLALAPLPVESAAAVCLVATDISESREKENRLHQMMAALVQAEERAEAARAEAERANAAKSEFLANMSHEIRTPMNGIVGMTDLALETELDRDQRDYLGMVKSSAHSLLGLINNILDFSKIEAGRLELESIDFSLHDTISNLLRPLVIRGKQKGIVLRSDIADGVPEHLVGDPHRLRQVLLNFADNALKFTDHGSVVLEVGLESGAPEEICLHFTVKDTGIGIPLEKQAVIFEAFAQADGSITRTHGGTGLGLAIAVQLIEQMRGRVWIESTPGAGTAFHFIARFGRGAPPAQPSLDLSNHSGDSVPGFACPTPLRILLVEDNVVNRALASALLHKRGHSLAHAVNGREAVAAAIREPFDVILMDVQMPEMDGFEATRLIRESEQTSGRHTPIVAMTAYAMAGDRARCLAAGMDEYLSKPIEKPALFQLLERIAANRAPVADLPPPSVPVVPEPDDFEILEPGPAPADFISTQRCVRIARSIGVLVFVIGFAVLLGWGFDYRPLMTVLPGLVAMKANTALAFCFGGLSLFFFTAPTGGSIARSVKFSTAFAAAVTLLGLLSLAEYALGVNFGIDQLLFSDPIQSLAPGRMAPITAFNFTLLGSALGLLGMGKRTAWSHALAAVAALTSLLTVVGYFYGATALYQSGKFTAVALHTAGAFLALSAGVWCASSHLGFMRIVTASAPSGTLIRRYGLAAIGLPFFMGWIQATGGHLGWYGPELGAAVFAIATVITFCALVWIGAHSLSAAEGKEILVQESLRFAQRDLEQRVVDRTQELGNALVHLKVQMLKSSRVEHANQQIMEHSLDVICTIDSQGRFLQVSRASEAVWGYRPDELIGRCFMDFVHPDDREKTKAVDESILSGEPERSFENRYLRKDGTVVPILWSANWSEVHQINFCVARDMTARKRIERELVRAKEAAEAANRSKSEFLANMSHEIRTPMNGIIGMTELVLDTELSQDQREYLDMARFSAHSLLGLLNDILDFSKIEAGKLELEAISFSLRDCLDAMLKPLGLRAEQKGLELTADIPGDVPDHWIGDPMRLRQILLNLIDNAIKFTDSGDVTLLVTAEPAADGSPCLHFSIADTGIGIPPKKQALIFEAFAQVDGSTTRHYGGTGLGLTIASQLVRQMGGRIWVESVVGVGTSFHFTACLSVRDTPPPNARSLDCSRLRGMPVLVVDDNAINRRILHATLAAWHMLPTVVASGVAAFAELWSASRAGTPYPLMILDGMMPGMDGFEVAAKIREHAEFSAMVMVMLSSAMPSRVAARCSELGLAGYLTKPVSQHELLYLILSAVGETTVRLPASPLVLGVPTARSLRILLAEDNVINRALAATLLEKAGHSVVLAVNGHEAVRFATAEIFDLIFMDVQMPEMDGFEATCCLRVAEEESRRHTPIVAMTAHAMSGDRERCLAAGMDDYLTKPLERAELLDVIDRVSTASPLRPGPSRMLVAAPPSPVPSDLPDTLRPLEEAPIFSQAKLLDRVDGDVDLLRQLVSLFQESTPQLLDAIRGSIARRSASDLAHSAHALLSSLGAFGALHAHHLVSHLEELGETNDFTDAAATFADVERETTRISTALETMTRSPASANT